MKKPLMRTALGASALLVTVTSLPAQDGHDHQEGDVHEAAEATADSPIAATVDGFTITEEDIEKRFMVIIMEQTRGRMLPPEQLAELRGNFRPQILEELIDDRLLDIDVDRSKVTMTQEELQEILRRSFDGQLMRSNYTREEFTQRLQEVEGITIDELLARQSEDKALRQALLHIRLIEQRYPDKVVLTDELVKERYERDLDSLYTKAPSVRASHILLGTDSMTEEEAKAKADAVLIECRKEGADFAELARTNSTGPSAPQGGDLGFFTKDAMVAPFAEAAYAMKVGEISDPVKTQFGFHIILVTGRREGSVITLEQAAPSIKDELRLEQVGPLRQEHLAELRKTAKIDYAEKA